MSSAARPRSGRARNRKPVRSTQVKSARLCPPQPGVFVWIAFDRIADPQRPDWSRLFLRVDRAHDRCDFRCDRGTRMPLRRREESQAQPAVIRDHCGFALCLLPYCRIPVRPKRSQSTPSNSAGRILCSPGEQYPKINYRMRRFPVELKGELSSRHSSSAFFCGSKKSRAWLAQNRQQLTLNRDAICPDAPFTA